MEAVDLEALALRAIELTVQRRRDPRLLVATDPGLAGPGRSARLLAGLLNAAGGRRALALFGVDGSRVVGLPHPPGAGWLDDVRTRFPGVVPSLEMISIEADGARIVALSAADPGTLVVARRGTRVVIPWFDQARGLADAPPGQAGTVPGDVASSRPAMARTATVVAGWLERSEHAPLPRRRTAPGAGRPVVAWRGVLELHLTGADGTVADHDCTAMLFAPDSAAALSLDTQVHPARSRPGVVRTGDGVTICTVARCRLFVAGARPVDRSTSTRGDDRSSRDRDPVHLLVAVRSPAGAVPCAGVVSLVPVVAPVNADGAQRWVF